MAKIRVAVFFGGRACEHDVSIISALQCMDAMDTSQYEIIPVYISREGAWYIGDSLRNIDFMKRFSPDAPGVTRVYPDISAGSGALLAVDRKKAIFGAGGDQLKVAARIDVAHPVMHGLNGEDGALAGLLELMNIPYTSTGLLGSAVGMDKIAMRQLFIGCGFPVLNYIWFTRDEWEKDARSIVERIEAKLSYPLYVKPANLGSSIGIARAKDEGSLREGIEVALSYDRRIIVETGVENPVEINCSALGFDTDVQVSVCEMPVRWEEFLSFEEKYLNGSKSVKGDQTAGGGMANLKRKIPAPIDDAKTERIQFLSKEIFRVLDCKGVVRIDYLLDGEDVYIGEINTIPGSLAFYLWEATGVPYARLVDRMVELAYRAHAEKSRAVFAFDSNILSQTVLGAKGSKR